MGVIIVPLGHFEGPDTVTLAPNLTIERTNDNVQAQIEHKKANLISRHPVDFTHCLIERNTACNNVNEGRTTAEEVILLMRLFKHGGIFFNLVFYDHMDVLISKLTLTGTERIDFIAVLFFMAWECKGIPTQYILAKDEVSSFADFVGKYRGSPVLRERPFFDFFRAYHEPYADDRFLRNTVGLEAALVNDQDDRSNINFKFKDRGACLLHMAEPLDDGPSAYIKRLNDIYKARSNLVHVNKEPPDWKAPAQQALIRDSEKFLRMILKLFLERPDLCKADGIDAFRMQMFMKGFQSNTQLEQNLRDFAGKR